MHSPSVKIFILEMKIVHDEDACCGDFRGSGPSGPIELPSYSNCIELFFLILLSAPAVLVSRKLQILAMQFLVLGVA